MTTTMNINYFIRNFVIGLIFFSVVYFIIYPKTGGGAGATKLLILITANLLCYPFAKAVYDKLAGFLMGDNIYIVSVIISLIIRWFIYMFAIFIAPFYLLFFIPSAVKYIKERG